MTTTLAPAPAAVLPALDRCDQCHVAEGLWAVLTPAGELLFCSHHLRDHAAALETAGYLVDQVTR